MTILPVAVFNSLFARLFPETKAAFRRLGYSLEESEELAQECFFRLCKAWFSNQDPNVLQPAYLFTIVFNLHRNRHRPSNSPLRPPDNLRASNDVLDRLAEAEDPLSTSLSNEERRIVEAEVRKLSKRQSSCLHLRLKGHSHQEIGQILGIAPGSVGAHLFKARQVLRRRLAPYFDTLTCLEEGDHLE